MPRRCNDQPSDQEPPKKKSSNGIYSGIEFKQGEVILDISNKQWKLGKTVGIGGFGEIYLASDDLSREVKTDCDYVAKIERHSNGPLFVEINCYLRIAKLQMIEEWKEQKKLSTLGMPYYVASGSHSKKGEKYRFLILPKYERDIEQILQEKKVFNLKTVLTISCQILDVLEYIHTKGYVHSDIKASNIMLGNQIKKKLAVSVKRQPRIISTRNKQKKPRKTCLRNLRPTGNIKYIDDIPYLDEVLNMHEKKYNSFIAEPEVDHETIHKDQIYLLDYGLASRYVLSNGEHRQFCTDERRAHAGTLLFCSRDAHRGVPSRRSDLESLAYNMVYWLTGSLPWLDDLEQPEVVAKKKIRCFRNLQSFLDLCFINDYPKFFLEYFKYLNELQFEENPDYEYIKCLFKKAIKYYGYKDDSKLDFENLEGWGKKQNKLKNKIIVHENGKVFRSFLKTSPLMPLPSNIIFKRPKLRKKVKDKKIKNSMMNWSKILMDPETIMKQATRERKTTEGSDPGSPNNLSSLDIESMNPTYAMLEVFNKCKERDTSPRYKGDSCITDNIDGYTPAMMSVYTRMKERQELEFEEAMYYNYNNNKVSTKNSRSSVRKRSQKLPKRSESPPTQRISSRAKSQQNANIQKREFVTLKKTKSIPIRRPYSLRG